MARKKRYHLPGALYHVMLRGNDGQAIFFQDDERYRMCLLIQEGVERYGHRIHAFCLMGNHIHLLVQVGNISLSTIIHNLAFRYSQFINRRYKKKGHLFQGRFRAILVQERAYFLQLLRYIHMNPVRAGFVDRPEEYRWSGHGAYMGYSEFVWVITHYGLAKFAERLDEARLKYCNYVLKQESEEELKELRKGFSDGQVLGDDNFLEDVRNAGKASAPVEIPLKAILEAVCEVFQVDANILISPLKSDQLSLARGAAIYFARQNGRTLVEMARIFRRDASSMSRLMQRFSKKVMGSMDIERQYRQLEQSAAKFAKMPPIASDLNAGTHI